MYRIEGPEDGGVPPGPNFKLIVILFSVAIFVIIVIAYFVLPGIVGHKTPVNPDHHPTSQVVEPVRSTAV